MKYKTMYWRPRFEDNGGNQNGGNQNGGNQNDGNQNGGNQNDGNQNGYSQNGGNQNGGNQNGGNQNGGNQNGGKTFSQEDVNKMLAENKRNLQAHNSELVKQLETLKKSQNLSVSERNALSQQIESLNTQHMTELEKANREKSQVQQKAEETAKALQAERDQWQKRYTDSTIRRELTDAAVASEAVQASQIVQILLTSASLEEIKNDKGEPTGQFETKIRFSDVDKDGKAFEAHYTAKETLKRMKELPNLYGNLFKNTANAGTGGSNTGQGNAKVDFKDHASYVANREAILNKY